MDNRLALAERDGLPDALRVLLQAYPRETWESHRHFGELVQFWLQRHLMFRNLVSVLTTDAQNMVSGRIDFATYTPRLSQYAGTLLNELHTHHHVEDHHYFPRLVQLDHRLIRGFELLDRDHHAMDELLHGMATQTNTVLRGGEQGVFLDELTGFAALLERHLTDEEEIIVPVILDNGFTG